MQEDQVAAKAEKGELRSPAGSSRTPPLSQQDGKSTVDTSTGELVWEPEEVRTIPETALCTAQF